MIARTTVAAEALRWIGTPYRHQASVRGAGCDCIGLVRGVWRAVSGAEIAAPADYSPDWAERSSAEPLLDAARHHLVATADAKLGDVLLFRMVDDAPVKHAAILTAPARIAHAYWGRAVVESRLDPFWRSRIAAAFSFPGVE